MLRRATVWAALLVAGGVAGLAFFLVDAGKSSGCEHGTPGCAAQASAAAQPVNPCGTSATPPTTYRHVIWIWMENKPYSEIIGSTAAPYMNQLAARCGLATNYHAITHPSLPNYIAATSGDTWGIKDDAPPSSHPLSAASIYSQVRANGGTWRDYEESAPRNCPYDKRHSGKWVAKHDPALYYTNIRADCANWDVPMGTTSSGKFITDLQRDTLPTFAFVTPNICNDMHNCSISTGDSWLGSWVPLITQSAAYQAGTTALFITFDEDDKSEGNRVATIVVSPYTATGTRSATAFNHYSLLKTAEQMLGITTFLRHAGDAATNGMRPAFGL